MMGRASKKGIAKRIQYGALPYRFHRTFGVQVLLVTSRETKRWVIPKGWPKRRKEPWDSAAREAKEEAGVVGRVSKEPVGSYLYRKLLRSGKTVVCEVQVFGLAVKRQQKHWREKEQRETAWFSPHDAAKLIQEPVLRTIVRRVSRKHWDRKA